MFPEDLEAIENAKKVMLDFKRTESLARKSNISASFMQFRQMKSFKDANKAVNVHKNAE